MGKQRKDPKGTRASLFKGRDFSLFPCCELKKTCYRKNMRKQPCQHKTRILSYFQKVEHDSTHQQNNQKGRRNSRSGKKGPEHPKGY